MFLLKIGVPQTCFEISLAWSSSKVRLWIHKGSIRNNPWSKSYNFLMEDRDFQKDRFPPLCEQGDDICQIK